MAAEGQQQTVRAEDVAVMGITEILRHIPRIIASYRRLVASIRLHPPDVAVLIDFPDVNFRLAKHLHAAGVPVIWFVSPQLWAWKRKRLRWMQERISKILVIFPFEETFYRNRGVDAEFIGHPLAEIPIPTISREEYAQRNHLDPDKIWIPLLPGSRWKEIEANLPAMYELAVSDLISTYAAEVTFDGERLELPANPSARTQFEFLLPVASTIDRNRLEAYLHGLNSQHFRYLESEAENLRVTLVPTARDALHHGRAAVVASGTATIQATIIGNPFVVVYRVSPLTFAVARKLVQYPEEFASMPNEVGDPPIAMVNLIAQRRLVPELLQGQFTASNVAQALAPLLTEGRERDRQITGLAVVRKMLAPQPGDTSIGRLSAAVVSALTSSEV